jgi:flagellin-like hook-associated protein FlgL
VVGAVDHGDLGWTIVLNNANQLNVSSVATYTVNGNTYTQSFNTDLPTTLSLLGDKVVAGEPNYQSHNNQIFGGSTHVHLAFVDTAGNQLDTPAETLLIIETSVPATATSTLDFNNLNLVEGDRITLTIASGTHVQGTIGSAGLDTLITTMASDVAAQTGLFSAASSSSGVLTLTGLTDGSAMTDVTVTLESYASIADISLLTPDNTASALTSIDQAIRDVSDQRSLLGAFQNRLSHATSNLTNMASNTESARSVIANADYAAESSRLVSQQMSQRAQTAMIVVVKPIL